MARWRFECSLRFTLPEDWLGRALERVKLKDRVKQVQEQRKKLQERLRRMAKAFVDGLFDDGEYRRQKEQIEFELASMVVPEADITEEAGKLLLDLPQLWAGATSEERRGLLLTILDAVYVDTQGDKRVVEVRPKAAFGSVWNHGPPPHLHDELRKTPAVKGSRVP